MPDIYLPNIIKLELTNFSLYCEQSVVMDFSKPVSCLMGANGIGKSTLLNCVNFAITGRINPTNKKLKSIDTLDRGNNYYLQYFDGRISEVDKDYASTRIVFMLGNKRIEVVRNFFPDNSILEYKLDNETQDPRNYEDDVVRLANLNNYAQFVFLQLKVLTFDESRDCLFWNPSILTPTIFLCLGESVDNAERADELAREIQKVNSRIRNVQWEISRWSAEFAYILVRHFKALARLVILLTVEADVIVLRHLNVLCGAFVVAVADVVRAAVFAFSAGHLLSSFPQRGFSFFTFSL